MCKTMERGTDVFVELTDRRMVNIVIKVKDKTHFFRCSRIPLTIQNVIRVIQLAHLNDVETIKTILGYWDTYVSNYDICFDSHKLQV